MTQRATLQALADHCQEFEIRPAPINACVYLLLRGEVVIYVGASCSLDARIRSHQEGSDRRVKCKSFDRVLYLTVPQAEQSHYEGALIRAFRPECNGSAPADSGRDAEILVGIGLGHLVAALRPFGKPWGGNWPGRVARNRNARLLP